MRASDPTPTIPAVQILDPQNLFQITTAVVSTATVTIDVSPLPPCFHENRHERRKAAARKRRSA